MYWIPLTFLKCTIDEQLTKRRDEPHPYVTKLLSLELQLSSRILLVFFSKNAIDGVLRRIHYFNTCTKIFLLLRYNCRQAENEHVHLYYMYKL